MSRADGDYASTAFDIDSGVLVASTGRAKGVGSPVHGPLDDPEGNVQVMFARLVDVRQRDLPGLGAPVPAWVIPGTALVYQGEATVTNPFDPSGFGMGWPVEVVVTLDEVGTSWATFRSTTATDFEGYVERSETAGATGSTGLYWYDPASLAAMTPGTLLDEDPVTTARLSVESADGSNVTLLTEAPGVTARATYEVASGDPQRAWSSSRATARRRSSSFPYRRRGRGRLGCGRLGWRGPAAGAGWAGQGRGSWSNVAPASVTRGQEPHEGDSAALRAVRRAWGVRASAVERHHPGAQACRTCVRLAWPTYDRKAGRAVAHGTATGDPPGQ